jgi:heme/copper-type cytochrome/quinol oxidase subunit 2
MTLGGWIIMLSSVGVVTGLLAWCMARVLRKTNANQPPHRPAEHDAPGSPS